MPLSANCQCVYADKGAIRNAFLTFFVADAAAAAAAALFAFCQQFFSYQQQFLSFFSKVQHAQKSLCNATRKGGVGNYLLLQLTLIITLCVCVCVISI
jgi:hypothetical protein